MRRDARLYKPLPGVYIAGQRANRAPADKRSAQMGGIIHETRLYPAYHDLQPQSGRGTERSQNVGAGASAVRARQEIHPRNRRPDVGRIRKARREKDRSLELHARAACVSSEGQGQGQGSRPLELLPARRRDRPGAEESRLRLYRGRACEESDGLRDHELLGARHRQHGSAGARRHQGAEGQVAEAAVGRRNPFRLRDDRAECRVVGRQEHLDLSQTGRRRVGDQRREVLHLRRRDPRCRS